MGDQIERYHGNIVISVTEEQRDGHIYERVYVRPGVSVIAITPPGHLSFVKEKDWSTGFIKTKLVTGYIGDGEDALERAKKELDEELGAVSHHWELLHPSENSNPTINQTQTYFIAHDIIRVREPHPEPGEKIIGSVDLPPRMVREKTLRGEFGTGNEAFALVQFFVPCQAEYD